MSEKRYRLSNRSHEVLGYVDTLAELEPLLFLHRLPSRVYDLNTRMTLDMPFVLEQLGYHSLGWCNDWDHIPNHPKAKEYNSIHDWHELVASITGRNLSASPSTKTYVQFDSGD